MPPTEAPNTAPCGGTENEHNGCGLIFPRRGSLKPICNKCARWIEAGSDPTKLAELKLVEQCAQCGLAGLRITNPCGSCKAKDAREKGVVDTAAEASRQERGSLVNQRMAPRSVMGAPSFAQSSSLKPMTGFHALQSLTSSGSTSQYTPYSSVPASQQPLPQAIVPTTLVIMKIRPLGFKPNNVGTQFAEKVGIMELNHPSDDTMDGLLSEAVRRINVTWDTTNTESLAISDCTLRMPSNTALHPEDSSRTVAAFLREIVMYRPNQWIQPKHAGFRHRAKHSYLNMEVLLDHAAFRRRTRGEDATLSSDVYEALNSTRRRPSLGMEPSDRPQKRAKGAGTILVSMFAPDAPFPARPVLKVSDVWFTIQRCKIDPITSAPKLESEDDHHDAKIADTTMTLSPDDVGVMKDVYKMTWDKKSWAAKKVVKLGPGPRTASGDALDLETIRSLILLKRLESFYARFESFVAEKRLTSSITDFQVSDGFIADIGVVPDAHATRGNLYLVEPLRSSTRVRKFTGTMVQTKPTDKAGATIAAFTHWVMQDTACNLCFADVQGTECLRQDGRNGYVLFDPMTHSLGGNSGAGDHGKEGLQAFIREHSCVGLCDKLGLADTNDLKATLEHHVTNSPVSEEDDDLEVDSAQSARLRSRKGKGRMRSVYPSSQYATRVPSATPGESLVESPTRSGPSPTQAPPATTSGFPPLGSEALGSEAVSGLNATPEPAPEG